MLVVGGGILMLIAKLLFLWYYVEDIENKIKVCAVYCFAATVMMFGSPLVAAVSINIYFTLKSFIVKHQYNISQF